MQAVRGITVVAVFMYVSGVGVEAAEWTVHNDLGQAITVYINPVNNPNSVRSRTIPRMGKATFKIQPDSDPHQIRGTSTRDRGPDVMTGYGVAQRNLDGVHTELSEIWSPRDERVNGMIVFDYMDTDDYQQDEEQIAPLDRSLWLVEYGLPDGGRLRTDLCFSGSSGSYHGGMGNLSNVVYQNAVDGSVSIHCNWKHGNSANSVTFVVENNATFRSTDGVWRGWRAKHPDDF